MRLEAGFVYALVLFVEMANCVFLMAEDLDDGVASLPDALQSEARKRLTALEAIEPDRAGLSPHAAGANVCRNTKPTSAGRVVFAYVPPRHTTLRMVFLPPSTQPAARTYLTTTSVSVSLTPHVRLTVPVIPSVVRRGHTVAVTGFVTPRHASGSTCMSLMFQRLEDGAWITASPRALVCHDNGVRSSYRRLVRFATPGSWRVRAVHTADGAHARTSSRWRAFSVR